MHQIAIENLEPISVFGVGNSGLLKHHRSNLLLSLITEWDGDAYCFYLDGQHANRYFKVDPRTKVRGTLIRSPDIIADFDSAYDAVEHWDPLGALVLADGKAYIVGVPFGDGFADPIRVPLWKTGMKASQGEAVGFKTWKLVLPKSNPEIELWRQSGITEAE